MNNILISCEKPQLRTLECDEILKGEIELDESILAERQNGKSVWMLPETIVLEYLKEVGKIRWNRSYVSNRPSQPQ